MSDQPTGEWTYVPGAANPGRWSFGKIVCGKVTICEHIEGELYGRQIADTHNSELAAEQEKREQIEIAIADLSHPNCQMLLRKERQFREQLAVELERVTIATQMVQIESKRANEAEQKVHTLVDALKGMLSIYEELHARYDLGDCQATVDARDALSKVAK